MYDLIVIGGGSGGVRAARMAASYGANVAIIEEYRYGGTCVIRGCVPKKHFVHASRFPELFEVGPAYGWTVDAKFDWPTLKANKDKEIARLEGIYGSLLGNAGVEIIRDRGEVTGPNSVRLVKAQRELEARYILIATGDYPMKPDIPGVELGITSNEAFELKTLPGSILIEGAGYVAVEFAGIFAGLGVKTTLCYRRDNVLRGFDPDLRKDLHEAMARRGVMFRFETSIAKLSHGEHGIKASFQSGDSENFGAVMFATGRWPATRNMGLEAVGVEMNDKGVIKVDKFSQTSVPSIYAVGDVTGRAELTPVAIREGAAFAETVFQRQPDGCRSFAYSDGGLLGAGGRNGRHAGRRGCRQDRRYRCVGDAFPAADQHAFRQARQDDVQAHYREKRWQGHRRAYSRAGSGGDDPACRHSA